MVMMDKKICFLFTGQGSQYYGMGETLYKNNLIFKKCMDELDRVVIEFGGYSVLSELYDPKKKGTTFNRLEYTHPAIFMVEYSLAQTMIHLGIKPDMVLGSSLGEITALAVAGCESAKEILKFIILQPPQLKKCCKIGGMVTVLDDYRLYEDYTVHKDGIKIISINGDSHFVMSGTKAGIENICSKSKTKGYFAYQLPVEYGFHTECIEAAKDDFIKIAEDLYGDISDIPVYSCELASIRAQFCADDLWNIVRNPIRMRDTVARVKDIDNTIFIDMSPQGTMATLVKMMINRKQGIFHILTQFNREEECILEIRDKLGLK